jgi:protease-4
VQPKSDFAVSGAGGGEIFLRGLFDKIQAEPQLVKRAEYKSAADMFMEKAMTEPDRTQLNEVMQSWYGAALTAVAAGRHLSKDQVRAAFEASPQFAEDAMVRKLVDHIGYDDDALAAAKARAGADVKTVKMRDYIAGVASGGQPGNANIAVIEAAGEIADGAARGDVLGGASGIASDDLSAAIRRATADKNIKAIILRVDSPGGSVTASDQILDAVKKAQAKGKPVVVSMGAVAASGGYYISASADRIVAQPATLTGSIGVLTGKVSVGKTLGMIGVGYGEVSAGKNTLMDSALSPYTPDQMAALNHEADVIYDDFLRKVAAGRKLSFAHVQDIARGRVWTGVDARTQGLVNELGGFWTAARLASGLAHLPQDQLVFGVYPRPRNLLGGLEQLFGQLSGTLRGLTDLQTLVALPALHRIVQAIHEAPKGGVELRAVNLPGADRN